MTYCRYFLIALLLLSNYSISQSTDSAMIEQEIKQLIDRLSDKSWQVREDAIRKLSKAGAVPHLIAALNDEREAVRKSASTALVSIGTLPAILAALESELEKTPEVEPQWNVVDFAIGKLARMGSEAEPAIPLLMKIFELGYMLDNDVVDTLCSIGSKGVYALVTALEDEREHIREEAALAFRDVHRELIAAPLPKLINALRDDSQTVRETMIATLAQIGIPALQSLIAVIEEQQDALLVQNATRSIAYMGAQAAPALPALMANLQRDDPFIRIASAMALFRIGARDKKARALLVESLKIPQQEVVNYAIHTLGNMKKDAEFAIPILVEMLNDDKTDKKLVLKTLLKIRYKPRLGMATKKKLDPNLKGLLVQYVSSSGRAYSSGIRKGDRLIRFSGVEINTLEDLLYAKFQCKLGSVVEIHYMRKDKLHRGQFVMK